MSSGPIDWLFRNRRTGRITIAQWPNLALWIVLGCMVGRRLLPGAGLVTTVVDVVGTLALAWWAIDEIVRGVNPWRRILGAVVLVVGAIALVGQAM